MVITFCVSRRRRKMYCGHARLCVCLCHGQHAVGDGRYFLVSCDKRKHTSHAHQQAASHASTDSAWRHPVWLPHSSLGFQRPAGRRSYHNKLACAALLRLTPQATIARNATVACTVRKLSNFTIQLAIMLVSNLIEQTSTPLSMANKDGRSV